MIQHRILSVASALAAISIVPTDGDLFNEAIRGFLATAVAIIAYFMRELLLQGKRNTAELKKQNLILQRHQIMFSYWIAQARGELEARQNEPGRRKSDIALMNLLDAIQDTEVETEGA